jgi:hypothetical protein
MRWRICFGSRFGFVEILVRQNGVDTKFGRLASLGLNLLDRHRLIGVAIVILIACEGIKPLYEYRWEVPLFV